MAKTRVEKETEFKRLISLLQSGESLGFVDYQGLKVADLDELRADLFKQEIGFRVVKTRLLKIALAESGLTIDGSFLERPLALANASDEIKLSKALIGFEKNHPSFEVLAGLFDGRSIAKDLIVKLASLPSREELLARLFGRLRALEIGLLRILEGPIQSFTSIVNQLANNKQ